MNQNDKNQSPYIQYNDKQYIPKLKKLDSNLNKVISEIIEVQAGGATIEDGLNNITSFYLLNKIIEGESTVLAYESGNLIISFGDAPPSPFPIEPEEDDPGELLIPGMFEEREGLNWNGSNLNVGFANSFLSYPTMRWVMPPNPGFVADGYYLVRGTFSIAGGSSAVQINFGIYDESLEETVYSESVTTMQNRVGEWTGNFHIPADWDGVAFLYMAVLFNESTFPFTLLSILKYTYDEEQLLNLQTFNIGAMITQRPASNVYWNNLNFVIDPKTGALPDIEFNGEFSEPILYAPGRLIDIEGSAVGIESGTIEMVLGWKDGSGFNDDGAFSDIAITSANQSAWEGQIKIPDNWPGLLNPTNNLRIVLNGPDKKLIITSMKVATPDLGELFSSDLFKENGFYVHNRGGSTLIRNYGDGFENFEMTDTPPTEIVASGVYTVKGTAYTNEKSYTFEIGYISSGTPVWSGSSGFVINQPDPGNFEGDVTIPSLWNGTDTLICRLVGSDSEYMSADIVLFSFKEAI